MDSAPLGPSKDLTLQSSRDHFPIANLSHIPTHAYAQNKLHEPPRIGIPAPLLEFENGHPEFTLRNAASSDYDSNEFGNPAFLQALVEAGDIRVIHQLLDWKYEMRRSATKLLPFLFLGPMTAARDAAFVKDHGITLLVAVRHGVTARTHSTLLDPSRFASSKGIQTLKVDLDSSYDLMKKLPQIIKAINDHLEASCKGVSPAANQPVTGKVLVFCESGNDRSVAVVSAYLMVMYGLDAVSAMQLVQSQRFCISVEESMKSMLFDFEGILQAKRDVANAAGATRRLKELPDQPSLTTNNLAGRRARKRNIETMYDSEDGTEDEMAYGQEGRNDWAPFQDITS